MKSRPNVNPFYIEPSKRAAWEEYDDFEEPDEEEMEEELLLPRRTAMAATTQQQWQPPISPSSRRRRERHSSPRSNRRILCIFGFVTIVFLLLISSNNKGSASSATKQQASSHNGNATQSNATADSTPENTTVTPATAPTTTNNDSETTNAPVASPATPPPVETTPSPTTLSPTQSPVKATNTPTQSPKETVADTDDSKHNDKENSSREADEIEVFGLRNGGLDWYHAKLKECYPNHTITTRLTRETMWIQDRPQSTETTGQSLPRRAFVFVVRNVYDWVEAMRINPMHMPAHTNSTEPDSHQPLPWMEFVQKAWKPPGSVVVKNATTTTKCQLGFTPEQVVPCTGTTEDHPLANEEPVYELDSEGNVFDNILALRAFKIRHFTKVLPTWWWPNVVDNTTLVVQYEKGPDLSLVDKLTGWTHACSGNLIKPEDRPPSVDYTQNQRDYLKDHVDWTVEKLVGYDPKRL